MAAQMRRMKRNEAFTKYMTRNDCYTAGRKITPKGIMVHSTAVPGVMAAEWFSRWNKSYKAGEINRQVCVHAFVDDKEVWQYLPWIIAVACGRSSQQYPYWL